LRKRDLFLQAVKGRTKTAIFSVTTSCNCNCAMCGIPSMENKTISLERARDALDDCSRNGVLVVSFTGGEPLMHPHIVEIIQYAKAKGMVVHVATNGTLPQRIRRLGGLVDFVGFSLDSHRPEEHDRNRRRRNCSEEVARSVRVSHMLGIKYMVNAPPNKMIKDSVREYVEFVNTELGCPVGFCYPMVDNGGYYDKGSNVVSSMTPTEIVRFYSEVIELKRNGSKIANTESFLRESMGYTLGREVSPCRAGKRVVWVDWSGAVHPCFNKKAIRLNYSNDGSWCRFDASKCSECFNQCFREPSLIGGNLANAIRDWRTYRYFIG
jgi:MoaA/NifB/PqqE/SkfB family radical SAM enzyme